jgi:hypothetical protein
MFGLQTHERVTVTDRTAKDKRGAIDRKPRTEQGEGLAIGVPSAIGFR